MGAHAVGRLDRRMDRGRAPGVLSGFLRRIVCELPGLRQFLRYHQIVDIYKDENAYFVDKGWMKIERPSERRPDGTIQSMMKDENWFELVVGDKSRSGGQWDIWEATYSPVGRWVSEPPVEQGDRRDRQAVAEQWKKYDLQHILETNWTTLGPKIANKLNVYVGDMDSFYLNDAVEKLNEFLSKARGSEVHRRDCVSAPRAALLGTATRKTCCRK